MAESAVSAVVGRIGNLAVQEASLLCGVTGEVEFLKDELERLQGFLKDADKKMRSGDKAIAVCVRQIRDASYDAENIIEVVDYVKKRRILKKGFVGAISRYACLTTDLVTLHKVDAEIRRIRRKIDEIKRSMSSLNVSNLYPGVIMNTYMEDDSPVPTNFEHDPVVVGFEAEFREIVEKLVDEGHKQLSAVSIVGMGGAGKTTLVRQVYNSQKIQDYFAALIWVTVSQKFKGTDLLKEIMKQIVGSKDLSREPDMLQDYEVGNYIHDFLSQKRYLFVLDDVWETDTWEQMNRTVRVFPDANNGSRVILTTRKSDVAQHIQMPTYVHNIKLLDVEKSWELFRIKALPSFKRSTICNQADFEIIGRKLARKCNGLPLALAVLGGYLSKNLSIEAWSDVLLNWTSTKDGQSIRQIIYRSYYDLPNSFMKACFLYLAAFPEDYVVLVSDLIELWIAECLIPQTTMHKQEETARKYVNELAQRCLVQVVSKSKAHGWIETIRLHDILRDWCMEEARQDRFFNIIDLTAVGASSFRTMISYRTSLQNFYDDSIFQATPGLRTLVGFELSVLGIPKIRFLRVLHVENSILNNFSVVIGGCIHLRYLKLRRCKHVILPYSIGQLLFLQTVDLRGTRLDSVVPKSLWYIPALRHIYLTGGFFPLRIVNQKEIQTIWLDIPFREIKHYRCGFVKFLSQLSQVTTLSLDLIPMPAEMINVLVNMPHLVDIYLNKFDVLNKLPDSKLLSQTLRQLRLFAVVITEDPMPILEKLPCLVLELSGYVGKTMCCTVQGFPMLQQLEVVRFSIEDWMIENGTMPRLSHLTLYLCEKMSVLPKDLLHLPSLNELTLLYMSQISGGDNTLKDIQRKGCKVTRL